MPHEGFGVVVEAFGEVKFPLEDILVDDQGIVISEGVDACYHLIDEHAQRPPVHWLPVSLILQDLRSQVLRRPAQSKRPILNRLGKAKISQLEVPIGGDEDVLWLQVAVDDVAGVQVLEDADDVRGVEAEWRWRYAALWGSNMPSSRRCVKSYPPGTYSRNMYSCRLFWASPSKLTCVEEEVR